MPLSNKTIIIFCFLIIIAPLYFFIKKPVQAPQEAPTSQNPIGVVSKLVKINEISPDQKKGFFINAEEIKLQQNDTQDSLICKNVNCTMVTEKEESIKLHSKNTVFNIKTKDLLLEDKVTGTFNDINLEGSNFSYSFDTQVIKSDQKILLSSTRLQITANKTEIDLKNKTVILDGDIKSVFT